ncbi:hypothetical protein GBA52_014855 [Prunus armeniaca]|nr:hypothetical protein GBA52_014855 [Prunus armeniaca]
MKEIEPNSVFKFASSQNRRIYKAKPMARRAIGEQLIIPNENLYIQHKEPNAGGKSKCSKTATKKGGVGFGSRKALNDITNKILPKEASSKKKTLPKEDFNVAEEVFARSRKMNKFYLDTVLPVQGSYILNPDIH